MAYEKIGELRKVRVGRNIYPDFEDLEWQTTLRKFGIEVNFLLDDGVVLSYPENLEPFSSPGDVSFYDTRTKQRVVTWCENFGQIEVFGPLSEDEPIATIKILDGYDTPVDGD